MIIQQVKVRGLGDGFESYVYHLKSCITLTAESQPLIASFAATIAAAALTFRRSETGRATRR